MAKFYDFEFYRINSYGDWKLYRTKTTSSIGRRFLLQDLKMDGYVYNRSRKAYFQTCPAFANNTPVRYACIIIPLNTLD